MKSRDFMRAVARATGESVSLIRALGFSPLNPPLKRQRAKNGRRRSRPHFEKLTPGLA
jgi:hypothetical protein